MAHCPEGRALSLRLRVEAAMRAGVVGDRREEIAQWTAAHLRAEPESGCYCVTY